MARMLNGGEEQALQIAKNYVDYLNTSDGIISPNGVEMRPRFQIDETVKYELGRGIGFLAKPNKENSAGIDLSKVVFVVTADMGKTKMAHVGHAFDLSHKSVASALEDQRDVDYYWDLYSNSFSTLGEEDGVKS